MHGKSEPRKGPMTHPWWLPLLLFQLHDNIVGKGAIKDALLSGSSLLTAEMFAMFSKLHCFAQPACVTCCILTLRFHASRAWVSRHLEKLLNYLSSLSVVKLSLSFLCFHTVNFCIFIFFPIIRLAMGMMIRSFQRTKSSGFIFLLYSYLISNV